MAENKQLESKRNQTLVLKAVRQNPGISRIRIAADLGLNRSTITHIVNDLLSRGIVGEVEIPRESKVGGRKPIGLVLEKRNCTIMGIEWQIDFIRYVVLDLSGQVLKEEKVSRRIGKIEELTVLLKQLLQKVQEEVGIPVKGLGIGIPGRVNPHKGIIIQSLPLGLSDFPLADSLEGALRLPVLVENDANCFAWGENLESPSNVRNILCIILEFHNLTDFSLEDQEIGMGLVQNGQVYYGSRYSAGELKGSLIDSLLTEEFLRYLRDNSGIYKASVSPEKDDILDRYFSSLFSALAPIVSTLDPEMIFLGGQFSNFKKMIRDYLNREDIFTKWEFSSRKEYEVSFGSAGHFLAKMFSTPDYEEGVKNLPVFWDSILK